MNRSLISSKTESRLYRIEGTQSTSWRSSVRPFRKCQGSELGSCCATEFDMELIPHLFGSGKGFKLPYEIIVHVAQQSKARTMIPLLPGFKDRCWTVFPASGEILLIGQMVQ
ncbi:hypothetical protein ACH5RR_040764 [Cinchona calisaya]|uniref:Uncharacterized protein n=1 Tax=Cinchona calisaya TaxID=153742 RepID=A0ABD2XWU5_9GENT